MIRLKDISINIHILFLFSDMRRDVQEIFRSTPHEKQVMMFSATLSKEIRPVCKKFMQDVRSVCCYSTPTTSHHQESNSSSPSTAAAATFGLADDDDAVAFAPVSSGRPFLVSCVG